MGRPGGKDQYEESLILDHPEDAPRRGRKQPAPRRRTQERAMNRRTAVLGLGSIVAAWPSCSHAQSLPRQGPWGLMWKDIPKICILSAGDDFRAPAIREAVEFWNAELSRLGSAFRLGTISRIVLERSRPTTSARTGQRRASLRLLSLNSVREANGDVIIALSDGDGFNPFTSPWPALRKVLVAIPSFRKYSRPSPGLARNVVAHELGHAIGLGHNEDATSLMCGGCLVPL